MNEAGARMKHVRVLLADDHPLTLEGLRAFIEPHLLSVGTASDGRSLVEAALRLKPDLIIVDITMPLLNGIDAAIQIKKALPRVKVLFVTMHISPSYLEAALNAGASGYIVKSAAREELLDAIRCVINGRLYISPGIANAHMDQYIKHSNVATTLRLSMREREVLQLIAEGRTAKEIAYILTVSVKTVAFHRENIKRKLGLRSTAELTKYALEQQLVH
jgi:DNA-binding NarL/FixJ family response regulator